MRTAPGRRSSTVRTIRLGVMADPFPDHDERTASRSRTRAASGSVGFILFGGPTIVAGLVPWLLTRWEADDQPVALKVLGVLMLLAGAALVLETTTRFALQGRGTPAPW